MRKHRHEPIIARYERLIDECRTKIAEKEDELDALSLQGDKPDWFGALIQKTLVADIKSEKTTLAMYRALLQEKKTAETERIMAETKEAEVFSCADVADDRIDRSLSLVDTRKTLQEVSAITGVSYWKVAKYAREAGWTRRGKKTFLTEAQVTQIAEAMDKTKKQRFNAVA